MLDERCCEMFSVRQHARQVACKLTHLACENDFTLKVQGIGNVEPTVKNGLAGFQQATSCWIMKCAGLPKLSSDVGNPLPAGSRGSALLCSVDRVTCLTLISTAYGARCRVGGNSLPWRSGP